MTGNEYKEHIRYTHNAYCRIVIRHASIDAARMLFAKWKREISLEYLSEEKYMPFSTADEYFAPPPMDADSPLYSLWADCFVKRLRPCRSPALAAPTDTGRTISVHFSPCWRCRY